MRNIPVIVVLVAIALSGTVATDAQRKPRDSGERNSRADAQPGREQEENDRRESESVPTKASFDTEKLSVTNHKVSIGGKEIAYTATAGNFILKDDQEKEKASYFFIAYTKDDVAEPARRPLTFSFNGGPGSCSVWLHLGAFGPKRVKLGDEGEAPTPPVELIENDYSILDRTDLVFMDPVSTGYSRPLPGEKTDQFHGVAEDVTWNAEFIHQYVNRNRRWLSPLFLAGESYGTFRASMLAHHLQGSGIYLNGVVLVSAFLSPEIGKGQGDLPFALALPTLTASAWHHKKLAKDLQSNLRETLDKVEAFALREYLPALALGNKLPDDERRKLIAQLARYTGVSEEFVEQTNLRLTGFSNELLRDQNLTLGGYDTRYTGVARHSATDSFAAEPSISPVMGAFAAGIRDYLSRDLRYETDVDYEILGNVQPWNWGGQSGGRGPGQRSAPDAGDHLAGALLQNGHFKVFLASGYYDMVTKYFVSDYVFSHFDLPKESLANIRTEYYEAGHMMYLRKSQLEKLKRDLDNFYDWATSAQE